MSSIIEWVLALILAILGAAATETTVPVVADRVQQVTPVTGTECLRVQVEWVNGSPKGTEIARPDTVRWSIVGRFLWFDWFPFETQTDAYSPDGSVEIPAGVTETGVCR